MTGVQGRDRLVAVVERAIEQQLPGGRFGVDIPSLAHEVVRQVRRQLAIERLQETAAKVSETLDGIAPARREEASREDGA
ncbi:hypothetical protein [Streptomyces lydicus]|uniref:hypothetical protein n=1 Tax=Streptomyces lydicus TaxID=47763 RepID=UPI0010134CA8|nr:hypothetical protein [Streptomyces lydicus]MCZ1011961.1 hypothetical protein [Streptomyces lydicus]